MKFLPPGYNTKDLEKDVKNKWRWEWLNEVDADGEKWGQWLKKPDISGVSYCEICGKTINYKSSGKKAFKIHADDAKHKAKKRDIKNNQVLPGSSKATPETESLQDRVAKQRAITVAFISEHCLPFTLADDLIKLAQRLSQDKVALDKTSLSKSSATYINTHGLAKSMKNELKLKLHGKMFSLNVDEATNNNNDKILNVIAQYFDENDGEIALAHLGSRKQNRATAAHILESIESILKEYDFEWTQVVSVLMDNCSTMRGVRGGVEALIRHKNPNLLDVSGDTIHMINNVAKTLLSTIDKNVQPLCSDLYYDIEESPKVKELFHELQTLMNVKVPKHIIRPISSRFLQMRDVSSRVVELIDFLTVYYFSFLTEEEKALYRPLIGQIFQSHHLSEEAQAAVTLLQLAQEKQQKSLTSVDRKDRILDSLFLNRKEVVAKLNLFRGLLDTFYGYVKFFQSEKPIIHSLHTRMLDVTRELLGMFIKPDYIPDSVSELVKLDVSNSSIHKCDKDLNVGKYAYMDINKARVDKTCQYWVRQLYSDLRNGYVEGAKKILQMPLCNKTLKRLSVLDPVVSIHSKAPALLKKLADSLPFAVPIEDAGRLASEADRYVTDLQVKDLASVHQDKERVDKFWTKVFLLKDFTCPRYPVMKKLVCAMLTIFSGPLIESTFNIMDDIVEKDRTKLTVINYEAVAIVKQTLKKMKLKSSDMKVNNRMKKACIKAYSTYQKYLKQKKEDEEKQRQERLSASVQALKVEKAKKISKLNKLRNKLAPKRKAETSMCTSKEWKRIKTVI